MSKSRLAGLICIFVSAVLAVLAFALPIYKSVPKVKDYNGKDAVIAGSGGFLFSAYKEKTHALSDFCADDLFSEKELSGYVSALKDISKQFSERGCDTVFVFVPSKISVYREKLPENTAVRYSETRRYTQLYDALSGAGEDVINVFAYFDAIKNSEQLYHTASDGLNDVGGYRLFEQTARHINEKYKKNIKIYEISDYGTEITEDISYPMTREYRNITGITVPNRTVTLKEKTVLYKDAGFDYEAT